MRCTPSSRASSTANISTPISNATMSMPGWCGRHREGTIQGLAAGVKIL